MLRIIREINATVKLANEIAATAGQGPRWTLFVTNRSFIAQVLALIFALAGMIGVPLPFGAEDISELIYLLGFAVAEGWAAFERFTGRTRTVWSREQALKAREEADALSAALRHATSQ